MGTHLGLAGVAVILMDAPLGFTVLVLLVLVHFSKRLLELWAGDDIKKLIVPTLILVAALNLIILSYLATPPVRFSRARVDTANGNSVTGAFIGRSGDGVYLATCRRANATTSDLARIRIVPADKVKSIVLGGPGYDFDYAERPSIVNLVTYLVQQDTELEKSAVVELDLRPARSVC